MSAIAFNVLSHMWTFYFLYGKAPEEDAGAGSAASTGDSTWAEELRTGDFLDLLSKVGVPGCIVSFCPLPPPPQFLPTHSPVEHLKGQQEGDDRLNPLLGMMYRCVVLTRLWGDCLAWPRRAHLWRWLVVHPALSRPSPLRVRGLRMGSG